MTLTSTRRRCPYCGASIELGACPVVATSFEGVEFLDDTDVDDIELLSGTRPLRFLLKTRWPVLAEAPRDRIEEPAGPSRQRSALETALAPHQQVATAPDVRLRALTDEHFAREDVPARACPKCEFPLPQSIDHRPAVVVAVVGINRVGKTHLLAASLARAFRQRGLAPIGCTEFVPDDSTSSRFMEDYFMPLFRRGEVLGATPPEDDDVRFRPLVFDVTVNGIAFSLVLHDIAGEVLGDHRRRAYVASYLQAARGMIFVVDPRDVDDLRDGLPAWILDTHELGGWDQGALLAACIKPDGVFAGRRAIPVAVTVAKADLLESVVEAPLPFLRRAPADEQPEAFVERIRTSSRQVEAFLEHHGAHNILGPAREYRERLQQTSDATSASVTFHAVSALGSAPDIDDRLTEKVQPINCVDPLGTILAQIVAAAPDPR